MVWAGIALAQPAPPLAILTRSGELTVGRDRYLLLTHVEATAIRVRGPGALTIVVRQNLPVATGEPAAAPGAPAKPPAPIHLILHRSDGSAREEVSRFKVQELPDRGRAYAETRRYRPSKEAVVSIDLPAGFATYELSLAEEAPLGAAFNVSFLPDEATIEMAEEEPGPSAEILALMAEAERPKSLPPVRPAIIVRAGGGVSLARDGGGSPSLGLAYRYPILDELFFEIGADALWFRLEGHAPTVPGVVTVADLAEVGYAIAPLRLGLGGRLDLGPVAFHLAAGGTLTLVRETLAIEGRGVDHAESGVVVGVDGRFGLTLPSEQGAPPLSLEIRVVRHPFGPPDGLLGDPVPVDHAVLELGYHVDL